MASNLAQNMKATAEGFLYAYDGDWSSKTTEISLKYRAPECQHIMLPEHLGYKVQTNESYAERFKHMEGKFTNAKMTIHDYVADVQERKAVAYTSMTAETPFGPFNNEYVWFFDFDETGKQITRIKEFLDSQATKEVQQKLRQASS